MAVLGQDNARFECVLSDVNWTARQSGNLSENTQELRVFRLLVERMLCPQCSARGEHGRRVYTTGPISAFKAPRPSNETLRPLASKDR
jgi:hypothetical protein